MTELDGWLLAKTQQLVAAVIKEEYESAQAISDDIDGKIEKAMAMLRKYPSLPHDELFAELIDTKNSYISLWEEHFSVPGEQRIKNI